MQRSLSFRSGRHCSGRIRERDEERVALRPPFGAAVFREGSAEESVVLFDQFAVVRRVELLHESGGPFDVREQERHRARRQRASRPHDDRSSGFQQGVSNVEARLALSGTARISGRATI